MDEKQRQLNYFYRNTLIYILFRKDGILGTMQSLKDLRHADYYQVGSAIPGSELMGMSYGEIFELCATSAKSGELPRDIRHLDVIMLYDKRLKTTSISMLVSGHLMLSPKLNILRNSPDNCLSRDSDPRLNGMLLFKPPMINLFPAPCRK